MGVAAESIDSAPRLMMKLDLKSNGEGKLLELPPRVGWFDWARYGVPSLIYCVMNNLVIYGVAFLGAPQFALCSNFKLVVAAVTNWFILGQRFTVVQWNSLILLCLALVAAQIGKLPCTAPGRNLMESDHNNNMQEMHLNGIDILQDTPTAQGLGYSPWADLHLGYSNNISRRFLGEGDGSRSASDLIIGLSITGIVALLSALAGSVNEFLLKKRDTEQSTMRKNCFCYQWGFSLNLLGLLAQRMQRSLSADNATPQLQNSDQAAQIIAEEDPDTGLFRGFSVTVVCLILLNASMGLTVSLVLAHLDSVIKGIGAVCMILLVTIWSWLFLGDNIDAGFILALAMASNFMHLYTGPHNDILKAATAEQEQETKEIPRPTDAEVLMVEEASDQPANKV